MNDETTDPPDPDGAPPPRWRRGLVAGGIALALACVVAVLWVAGPLLPGLPVPGLATYGRVEVESPEVYTRERLVNDRYRQDFWLREQLDALDGTDRLIGAAESTILAVGPATARAPAAETGPDAPAAAFREEFVLRSALRDKIRQLVLENLLDDRHDLTGNSIYGLKFDTGVIPGVNTHARPYVKVRIDLADARLEEALASPRFNVAAQLARDDDRQSAFDRTKRQFEGWTDSLDNRLRAYVDARWLRLTAGCSGDAGRLEQVAAAKAATALGAPIPVAAAAGPGGPVAPPLPAAEPTAMIEQALQYVMGIDPRQVRVERPSVAGGKALVTLPGAWGQFFELHVDFEPQGQALGRAPFLMQLEPFLVFVNVVPLESWTGFLASATGEERFRFWHARTVRLSNPAGEGEAGAQWALLVPAVRVAGEERSTPSAQAVDFVRGLTQDDLERLQSWLGPDDVCLAPAAAERGGCLLRGRQVLIDAPMYRFVKERGRTDAYSYAVFPRGDVDGVLAEQGLSAATPDLAVAGVEAGASAERRRVEARADPVVVNFASNTADGADVEFGWAVVAPGPQRPRQVSQMALVSVPAYLERLDLEVETGWLDRASGPIASARRTSRMSVSLPTDFEALDTLVARGARREGPAVDQSQFDPAYCGEPVRVTGCEPADVLIPGARLWRSTSVTLGGQQADQITVTPDMQGIIASFRVVHWPQGAIGDDSVRLPLTVWTSEGSDQVRGGALVSLGEGAMPICGR